MAAVFHRCKEALRHLDWILVGCIVLPTAMLVTLSVLRYTAYTANMFDLGHMAQAIWSSTQGRPLEFSYHGNVVSRLALHAELIYFLITPLYALFPSPITLVVVQALLFGLGGLPLYYLARRRIGNVHAARVITLIYLFCPVAQNAVLFDFHGDTLAMPLMMFMLEALDRKAWRAYGVWLLLALSCKLYIAVPICMLGAFLWLTGRRRVGAVTILVAMAWGGIVFLGIRPLFAASGGAIQQLTAVGYLQFYFGKFFEDLANTWLLRLATAIVVFAPVIPVVMYAPDWTMLAFGVALPVLLSSGPGPTFYYGNHRYAIVAPFLVMAVLNAIVYLNTPGSRLAIFTKKARRSIPWPVLLGAVALMTLLTNIGLVNTPLSPRFWKRLPDQDFFSWAYDRTARDVLKDHWLAANVPDDVPLLTSTILAPHLVQRRELHIMLTLDETETLNPDELLDKVDYVVLDGLLDYIEPEKGGGLRGNVTYDWPLLFAVESRPDFGLISARDGLLLFQKRPEGIADTAWVDQTLVHSVTTELTHSPVATQAEFSDAIGLVEAKVVHLGARRYRLQYVWLALDGILQRKALFAVTQLDGVEYSRMLHLPTIATHPTTAWMPGELITETFEVELPHDIAPGTYMLMVGWYDSTESLAYATDEHSRVGDNVAVETLDVLALSQGE